MALFRNYGQIWHTLPDGQQILINDITKWVTLDPATRNDPRMYLDYQIVDGDRPELLSYNLYDTQNYWWTVLVVNNIYDMENQWPRDDDQLADYIDRKYRGQNPNNVHHYLNLAGFVTDLDAMRFKLKDYSLSDPEVISRFDLQAVTIQEYEEAINRAKRYIKLIDPDYIENVDTQLQVLLNGG